MTDEKPRRKSSHRRLPPPVVWPPWRDGGCWVRRGRLQCSGKARWGHLTCGTHKALEAEAEAAWRARQAQEGRH